MTSHVPYKIRCFVLDEANLDEELGWAAFCLPRRQRITTLVGYSDETIHDTTLVVAEAILKMLRSEVS